MDPLFSVLPQPSSDLSTAPLSPEPGKGGFWRRAVAYSIDFVLVQLIVILFMGVGAVAIETASVFEAGVDVASTALIESFFPLFASIFLSYFTFFTYWGGQTPGKLLLRVRVVTKDLNELTLLRAFGRSLSYFLSSLFLGVGFMIVVVNRDKRALHDLIARTRVVKI